MGGGGSMGMANSSLKNNRSLVGKRKYKDLKNLIINESGKTELEFKKLNASKLSKIKDQIRLKARKKNQKNLILLAISLVLVVLITISVFDVNIV